MIWLDLIATFGIVAIIGGLLLVALEEINNE